MSLKGRFFGMAGVAGTCLAALIPALVPATAHAQTAGVAAFSGTASATVDWVGGSGSFSFSTGAPLGCEEAGVLNGTPVIGACSVSASGSFVNVVCGTGEAEGSATITNGTVSLTANFLIIFVAGVGVSVPNPTALSTSALPVGVVDISPNPAVPSLPTATPPNFGVCTPGFTVATVDALAGA